MSCRRETSFCVGSSSGFTSGPLGDPGIQGKHGLASRLRWDNWISIRNGMRSDPCLTPNTNINSKQIKDLNLSVKTVKVLGQNRGVHLGDLGH